MTPLLLFAGWTGDGVLTHNYHILTGKTPQNVGQRGPSGAHGGRGEFRKSTVMVGSVNMAGGAENRDGKFAGKKSLGGIGVILACLPLAILTCLYLLEFVG